MERFNSFSNGIMINNRVWVEDIDGSASSIDVCSRSTSCAFWHGSNSRGAMVTTTTADVDVRVLLLVVVGIRRVCVVISC